MPSVLVVDDDPLVRDLLGMYFQRELIDYRSAPDGMSALTAVYASCPDLVVLDVAMPGMDGYEVCRRIRAWSDVPVLFLSARTDETSKLVGLELGGDDYVTKPFSPKEVVARAKAIIRRANATPRQPTQLTLGNLSISPEARHVTVGGVDLHLTRREFDILSLLMARPGVVYTRDQIVEQVWGTLNEGITPRAVDGHVKHLRHKLSHAGAEGCAIETVLGVGYRLVADQ